MTDVDTRPLDNAAYTSLTGPHAHLAQRVGDAVRYPVDMSPFTALPPDPGARDWADLATLAGPGAVVALAGLTGPPPDDWEVVMHGAGVQLVDDGVASAPDDEAVTLTAADVPEMLALVGRTRPGPFLPRTIEMGTYLGLRRDGELIAMAGERLHPPGWTEISAVCTDARVPGARPGDPVGARGRARHPRARRTPRCCTRRRPTPARSGSTSRSASGCDAGRRSSRSGCPGAAEPAAVSPRS